MQVSAHSSFFNHSQAPVCISSAYQPMSCLRNDVTPSLKVQWRYWTITAVAFWGSHLYYVANVEEIISRRRHSNTHLRHSARATTSDRGRWHHSLRARWQFRLKTLVSVNSADRFCKSLSSKRSPASKRQISEGAWRRAGYHFWLNDADSLATGRQKEAEEKTMDVRFVSIVAG